MNWKLNNPLENIYNENQFEEEKPFDSYYYSSDNKKINGKIPSWYNKNIKNKNKRSN